MSIFIFTFVVMIKGIEFHNIIENIFEDVKGLHQSEQIQVNCPICQEREGLSYPDGKYNLEINTNRKVFRCWKCDEPKFSGSLKRLIKIFGTTIDYEMYKSLVGPLGDFDYDTTTTEPKNLDVKLPQEMISFSKMDPSNSEHFKAYNYLINDRLLTKDIILKYKLGFCTEGKYKNRIIIPSFNDVGEINYFVARNYGQKNINGRKIPPYLNPDVDKRFFIFNEGLINWDSTVYLVEGVFEMLSFPINTIPLLGKDLIGELYYKLKEKKPNVIILLDPDAFKSTIDLFYKIHSIYVGVEEKIKIIKLPTVKDDLDEIRRKQGIEQVIKILYSARGLTVDDHFIKKLENSNEKKRNRYYSYKKYFKG